MANKSEKKTTRKPRRAAIKPSHDTFVDEIASGKKPADAYQRAYPGVKKSTAYTQSSLLLKNPKIQEAITERKRVAALSSDISPEAVIGSIVEIATGSLADIPLLKTGGIDWAKAKKNGVDHLVKSVKVTRFATKDGREQITTYVELYDRLGALRELSDIFGLKQKPKENQETIARVAEAVNSYLERRPDADMNLTIKTFAERNKIEEAALVSKVCEIRDRQGVTLTGVQ